MHDIGFGAEEVAAVEPLLVTLNDKGEVEGVKYDRISVALVNAVKEQQQQIQHQRHQLQQQQRAIEGLKKLVCRRRHSAVCR
jgi:type III secretory pathway lipoprotein EscJ